MSLNVPGWCWSGASLEILCKSLKGPEMPISFMGNIQLLADLSFLHTNTHTLTQHYLLWDGRTIMRPKCQIVSINPTLNYLPVSVFRVILTWFLQHVVGVVGVLVIWVLGGGGYSGRVFGWHGVRRTWKMQIRSTRIKPGLLYSRSHEKTWILTQILIFF